MMQTNTYVVNIVRVGNNCPYNEMQASWLIDYFIVTLN